MMPQRRRKLVRGKIEKHSVPLSFFVIKSGEGRNFEIVVGEQADNRPGQRALAVLTAIANEREIC